MTPDAPGEQIAATGLQLAAGDAQALASLLDEIAGPVPWGGAVPHVMAMRLVADAMQRHRPLPAGTALVHEAQVIRVPVPLSAGTPVTAVGSVTGATSEAPVLSLDFMTQAGTLAAQIETRLRLAGLDALAAARAGRAFTAPAGAIELSPIGASAVEDYAALANDFNPIHLDMDAAQHAGLPDRVVHGMLLVALAEASLIQKWPGMRVVESRTRFLAPVLCSEGIVLSIAERGVNAGGRTLARTSIAISGGPLACVVDVELGPVEPAS